VLSASLLLAAAALAPPHPHAERLTGLAGIENVGLVAPGIYRGSRPTDAGLDSLKKLGVKTVVNLRHYHGGAEEAGCKKRGIAYEHVVLASSEAPSDADVRRFLEIVTDPARQPVYFHCWRGKDRTGVMAATYRMAVERWTLEEALLEMHDFGFYRGWHDLHAYVESLPPRLGLLWPAAAPAPIPAVLTR
jgi:tyrosine-protein phosphatase SIW14